MRICILIAALALAGCGTVGEYERDLAAAIASSEARTAGRVGQSLDRAIEDLGYPDVERTVAGHRIYEWLNEEIAGGERLACTLTYETDSTNLIKNYTLRGNQGLCIF